MPITEHNNNNNNHNSKNITIVNIVLFYGSISNEVQFYLNKLRDTRVI